MTIIDYHNQFWREFRRKGFSPNETMLYFYLLDVWNSTGRKAQFECKTSTIELTLEMNKMTITRCREKLRSRGLIKFVNGSTKGKYPHYSLCNVTDDVTDDVTDNVTDNVTIHRVYRDIEKEDTSNEVSKKNSLPSRTTERMDWPAFMQTFNEMLSPPIPKVTTMSETRRKKVKTIVRDFGKEKIMEAFDKIRHSDFLMGRNRKPNDKWQCCFDWIFTPSNFIKILEGNYDNGEQVQRNTASGFTSKQEANEYAFSQFVKYREARESGLLDEVEKPF